MIALWLLWFVPGIVLLWQMRHDFPVTYNRYISDVDWFTTIGGAVAILVLGPFFAVLVVAWKLWPGDSA